MILEILPARTAGAAENMAVDFLLLQRYPAERARLPRFRHYGWRTPAFTFGYGQKITVVRERLAALMDPASCVDLCRRPTGGGIVDHREDWTYSLVIPRGHPLEELRAADSYRAVHEALAEALRVQGVVAAVKVCEEPADAGSPAEVQGAAGVCFQRAETYDVVHAVSGEKIAGGAQKRSKHGLLFQGSVWRPAAVAGHAGLDWDRFEEEFTARLAEALGGKAEAAPWPEIDDEEIAGLTEQYSTPEWIEYR